MEINGPPPIALTPRQIQAAIGAWQIGQILQAQVIKQASPQAVILQVNSQPLLAETNISLAAGQRLELTVIQLGDQPVLQARLIASASAAPSRPPGNNPGGNTAGSTLPSPRAADSPSAQAGVTDNRSAMASRQAANQIAINTLLKQALPKQASMAGLLANIALLNNQPGRIVPLPGAIESIVKQIYRQLPTADRVGNAQRLKQGVANSGIFLENKLSKGAADNTGGNLKQALQQTLQAGEKPAIATTGSDLKAGLLRLLSAVQQATRVATTPQGSLMQPGGAPVNLQPPPFTPPTLRGQPPQVQHKAEATMQQLGTLPLLLLELGRQTEAALARTQLHQAASLPGGEQTPNSWTFELPLRNGQQIDLFDIVIEEKKAREQDDGQEGHPWNITLAFDLDGLGPVYARLRLIKDKVSTLFWAERAETTLLFNRHLNELSQRYREAGLEADELRCFQGTPPGTAGRNAPHIVLDVKA